MHLWPIQILGRFLLSFALLLSSPLASAGAVVCVENDGRIQIEAESPKGKCATCQKEHDAQHPSHDAAPAAEKCCIDIPLSGNQSIVSRQSGELTSSDLPVIVNVNWTFLHAPSSFYLSPTPTFPISRIYSTDLAFSRTVIILV